MKLTHLLTNMVVVSRMTTISGTNKKSFSTVTSETCHIQPISKQKAGIDSGVSGKTWKIYLEADTIIQVGDQLKDVNGIFYRVVAGGMTRRTHGAFDFYECIIEQTK